MNECRRNMSSSLSGQAFEDTGANTPTLGRAIPRSRKKHPMRRYLFAATAAAFLFFTGTAAAQPGQEDPVSGDDRATAYPGNAVAEDCASVYEGSSGITEDDLTHSVDDTETYLNITGVADGVEIIAVIVKGSDAFNEYLVEDLGDLPWEDLHSPLASSGKPAQISHWFACGVKDTTTTTTETTTETTSTTSETSTTDTSSPTSGESSSSSAAAATTTTTTSASVAVAADEDDLAFTGFNGGWLVVLAAALLLGGGALLLVVRLRTGRR